MNVLIVSYYFYPEITPRSFRTTELAKELARQGHVVKVLTKKTNERDQLEESRQYGFKVDFFESEPKDFRLKGKVGLFGKFSLLVNRVLAQFFDHPNFGIKAIVSKALRRELEQNSYETIISIAHPHAIHWGVGEVVRKIEDKSFTWIADCGDPYMMAENLNYKRPFYFWPYEKMFCNYADVISVPFEGAKNGYLRRYIDKIEVIPQGFNFDDVKKIKHRSKNKKETIRIGYAGTIVKGRRDPTELVEFLDEIGVNYEIHIYTNKKQSLIGLAKSSKGLVKLYDYVDRLELLKNLSKLDFVINFQNKGANQLPSKLIDYTLIEKPILNIEFGKMNNQIVEEFVNGNYKNQLKVNDIERYNIENVVGQFLNCSR